jgi:O-antigen/teichoic acid export membrane protein
MVFSKDFEFLVLNKIVSFVVTVGLAAALGNYWALVIGILTGSITSTLQSFRMHPYRPRLDLSEVRAMWAFSFWILVQNVLGFLNTRVDELIVGRIKSTTMMGYYNIAADIASSPVQEIILPLSRVLFPGIAQLAHQKEALAATFEKVVASVVIVVLSVSVGIALVAGDFVTVFLGARWLPIIPLVQILAIATGILVLGQPFLILLNVTDRSRTAATLSLVRQMLLMAAMVPAALYSDLQAVALARTGATVVVLALTLAVTFRLVRMNVWNLLRPVLAAVAMCGGVILVQALSPDLPGLRLVLGVVTGAVTYGGTLVALWYVAGRPASVESDMLAMLTSRLTGLRRQPK